MTPQEQVRRPTITAHTTRSFQTLFSNVTDAVDTREEYVKTHAVSLSLSFQASQEDGLFNYFKQVTKLLRRMEVLDGGKEYDKAMIVA